jgi:hypothetical protein
MTNRREKASDSIITSAGKQRDFQGFQFRLLRRKIAPRNGLKGFFSC